MAILVTDKGDFREKKITEYRQGHYIMIKESTYQKDTIILSVTITELQQDDKDDEEKITFNFGDR